MALILLTMSPFPVVMSGYAIKLTIPTFQGKRFENTSPLYGMSTVNIYIYTQIARSFASYWEYAKYLNFSLILILVLLLPALVVLLSNMGERKSYYLLLASSNEDWRMLRRFRVPYGDSEKSFQLDEEHLLYHVEPRLPPRPSQKEEEARVRAALENPVGAYKLSDLLNPKDKVVLLTDDWTRTTPAYKITPVVLEEVLNAGVKEKDIMVIVARGTHARLSKAQLTRKLGAEIVDRFTVENHDPECDLVNVGTSRMGTPAMINRRVVEADRKVAIGAIVAHPLMGYGGGAKIIVPGVAGTETININHSMGDHPKAAIGIANGNPVREDAEDIARMVGLDFIVNVIMNPKNEIVGAIAGDVVKAHREGVRIYDAMYGARAVKNADIVVLGASPGTLPYTTEPSLSQALSPLQKRGEP